MFGLDIHRPVFPLLSTNVSIADHEHLAGSSHAVYPAAGQRRPISFAGPHEEPRYSGEDSKAYNRWCYPDSLISVGEEPELYSSLEY